MNIEEQVKIDFYKGTSVIEIIKSYDMSREEKKVITDAILTSRKETPKMPLIEEADNLLKLISQTRPKLPAKKLTKEELQEVKKSMNFISKETKPTNKLLKNILIYVILFSVYLLAMDYLIY